MEGGREEEKRKAGGPFYPGKKTTTNGGSVADIGDPHLRRKGVAGGDKRKGQKGGPRGSILQNTPRKFASIPEL